MEFLLFVLLGSTVFSVWIGVFLHFGLGRGIREERRAVSAVLAVLAQATVNLALLAGAYYRFYQSMSDGQWGSLFASLGLYIWVPVSLVATLVGSLTLGVYFLARELSRRRSGQFAGQ